jgi:hypothetical protein
MTIESAPIPIDPAIKLVVEHYHAVWGSSEAYVLRSGPFHELPHHFCVLEFPPEEKRSNWIYATCGMSLQPDSPKLELHLTSSIRAKELVELLTITAHYHLTGDYLGLGHTVNFGRPWLPGSQCDYGLVSLPYIYGPRLEWLETAASRIRFLWLIPITLAERSFKMSQGLEALEKEFEKKRFNYLDPRRRSVV